MSLDARPAVLGVQARLQRLISQQRFEEAAIIRRRLEALTRTAARFHRIRSLAACGEIVAARKVDLNWEIHVIRYGRLAGAGLATPHEVPQAVARAVRATSETVVRPPDPLPAAGIEETERIADWLEQPGIRLIDISGDWMWPLHAVLDHETLVQYALGDAARRHTITGGTKIRMTAMVTAIVFVNAEVARIPQVAEQIAALSGGERRLADRNNRSDRHDQSRES